MDVINKIEQYAKEIKLTESGFLFLKYLEEYVALIQHDVILQKVLDSMYHHYENETVQLIKANSRSDSDFDIYIRREEIQPKIDEKYPIFEWKKLKEATQSFQLIKQYESEDKIPDIEVTLPEQQTELGIVYPSKVNLKNITHSVKFSGSREYFNTFHNAFIKILEEINTKGGIFSKYFDFDTQNGILYFQGKEIQINERKKITNAHHLLSFLFANEPFEQHFYKELDACEVLLEPKSWTSYYRACEDIQSKVKNKTGIEDFLDYNSGSRMYVRINPKYSSA